MIIALFTFYGRHPYSNSNASANVTYKRLILKGLFGRGTECIRAGINAAPFLWRAGS
jgi:hypothetical protein